jgi:hypothetical protein
MHELRIFLPEDYLYQGAPGQVLHFTLNAPTSPGKGSLARMGGKMENMPLTAKDALALWDSGKAVPAFQVETAPERQTEVYAAAFEIIRSNNEAYLHGRDLSEREQDVARSIAHVAKESGWAKMVSQHIHRDSPAITVRKPKE